MFTENRFMEILIIGALALIVVGPKDLPILMRRVGQFVGKMRGMAAEFRASFDELARQSELEELRKEVEALRSSHDSAVSQIHASLEDPVGGALGEITPNFMMPLNASSPTPIDGGEDFRPGGVVLSSEPEAAPEPARKPRAAASKAPVKPTATTGVKSAAKAATSKAAAKPRTKAAKAAGESA